MAFKIVTKKFTIPASGRSTITAILGVSAPRWIKSVTMRAKRTNSANVEWSDETHEAGGFLEAGEAAVLDWGDGGSLSGELEVSGTAGDIVYMSIDVNRWYYETGRPSN